jgi:hypothetical protein
MRHISRLQTAQIGYIIKLINIHADVPCIYLVYITYIVKWDRNAMTTINYAIVHDGLAKVPHFHKIRVASDICIVRDSAASYLHSHVRNSVMAGCPNEKMSGVRRQHFDKKVAEARD